MADNYQRVEPAPFDAAPPVGGAPDGSDDGGGLPNVAVPALVLLVLAALFVFFALPALIDNGDNDAEGTAVPPSPAQSPSRAMAPAATDAASSPAAETPYADAVAARARAEAQELLEELIDVRENLEERGALDWAGESMAAIAEQAAAGDERYRERDFDTAIERYREALDAAIALEASLPERFAQALQEVESAVEALDVAAAEGALARAERIDPGVPAIDDSRDRVAALPDVVAAVGAAGEAEAAGDLPAAVEALESAARLDTAHEYVAAELARVRVALTEQRFNAAMSEGYAALDEAAFDRAQARFERAAGLKPDAAEARAALQEVAIARTAAKLQALQRRGEALVADEEWTEAIGVFEEALAIDGSLRFAREGLALARPRAALDESLAAIIDEPGRLVDEAILNEARDALARAQRVAEPGEKLTRQLREVEDIVSFASTPLPVTLRSDGLTEVTVYKVARLGTFDTVDLDLRPGEYTAVGTRRGYRDVRVVFEVEPGDSAPVLIACSDPI